MRDSKIEWTDHTFNPWIGCTKVSQGCANCYALELMDHRYKKVTWGPQGTRVRTSASYWRDPFAWEKRLINLEEVTGKPETETVFCASLADVFEGEDTMPLSAQGEIAEARAILWDVIEQTPHLHWLLLTKRPGNIVEMVPKSWLKRWPLNAHPGTSIEDQDAADRRLMELLKVPAWMRWISGEPLLGPVNLGSIVTGLDWRIEGGTYNVLDGTWWAAVGDVAAINQHQSARSLTDNWVTPQWVIDALGLFDLDPCECSTGQPWPTAERSYSLARSEDGLLLPWDRSAMVWLNPPYSDVDTWMARLAQHQHGIALVFARLEVRWWFEHVWPVASAVWICKGRLTFCKSDGRPAGGNCGGPSAFVAYGAAAADRLRERMSRFNGVLIDLDHGARTLTGAIGDPRLL